MLLPAAASCLHGDGGAAGCLHADGGGGWMLLFFVSHAAACCCIMFARGWWCCRMFACGWMMLHMATCFLFCSHGGQGHVFSSLPSECLTDQPLPCWYEEDPGASEPCNNIHVRHVCNRLTRLKSELHVRHVRSQSRRGPSFLMQPFQHGLAWLSRDVDLLSSCSLSSMALLG